MYRQALQEFRERKANLDTSKTEVTVSNNCGKFLALTEVVWWSSEAQDFNNILLI